MILSAKALLDENPAASDEDIRTAIAGNLCRCTGYIQIIDSIQRVRGDAPEGPRVVAWRGEDGES